MSSEIAIGMIYAFDGLWTITKGITKTTFGIGRTVYGIVKTVYVLCKLQGLFMS